LEIKFAFEVLLWEKEAKNLCVIGRLILK